MCAMPIEPWAKTLALCRQLGTSRSVVQATVSSTSQVTSGNGRANAMKPMRQRVSIVRARWKTIAERHRDTDQACSIERAYLDFRRGHSLRNLLGSAAAATSHDKSTRSRPPLVFVFASSLVIILVRNKPIALMGMIGLFWGSIGSYWFFGRRWLARKTSDFQGQLVAFLSAHEDERAATLIEQQMALTLWG